MWKDYLHFSKSQRNGIILLIVLIVIAEAVYFILPLFYKNDVENENSSFLSEAKEFRNNLIALDSVSNTPWYVNRYNGGNNYKRETLYYSLFTFNPNTADSASFVRLGLKPYIASNIIKYRNKGGKFRKPADFSKIYGITPEKYSELEEYIQIPDETEMPVIAVKETITEVIEPVDLNSADTTDLMKIKGIGSYLARGILKFRNESGGFISIEQLKEINGMYPENFDRIAPFCRISDSDVKRIKVNSASVERLKRHPYLNFYQARAIYELRRKKGRLKGIEDLVNLDELNEETISKISPYFSFE